MGMW